MFDPDEILCRLPGADAPVRLDFDNGESTTLVPARCTPVPDDPERSLSLDGEWRVRRWPFGNHERIVAGPREDDRGWETVAQPGKVFYQDPAVRPGDVPNFSRVKLAHVDGRDGAILRKRVAVPDTWRGKRVLLRFGAIYPGGRVFVNGERLGTHLSGLTPVEWDVTDLVEPGAEALIAVRLLRRHADVDLDMPRHAMEFCGLAQSACLHAVEPVHVADYHLVSELDAACENGRVAGTVAVGNLQGEPASCRLAVVLCDPSGVALRRVERALTVAPGQEAEAEVSVDVSAPAHWSDESPTLYRVVVSLEASGAGRQEWSFRTAFRRLELSPDGPRLNGRFIKLRGVNHLTFHPEGGLHTPAGWLRRCLRLMKRANVNAIRTHFLAPPALAALCDEMGFYLFQELPIDWASDHLVTRRSLGPILQRVEGGIRRDRHHPSILAWTIGNENLPTADGDRAVFWSNMELLERLAKTLSPDKATVFPPPGPANRIDGIFETRVGDLADTHYCFRYARRLAETGKTAEPESWAGDYVERTRDELLARGWSGVWVSTEWGLFNSLPDVLNAPYLSLISDRVEDPLGGRNTQQTFLDRLEADWGRMRDDPTCLGGFYFPWMCAGAGDPWGWTLWGEDADWGVVTHELLPKPGFWALRVAYSPIRLPARVTWRPGQTELTLPVRSLYHRTDLAECTFRTMMGGGPPWMCMLRDWQDVPASCPPGGESEVAVPIWNEASLEALAAGRPIVCRCIVLDGSGYRPITHDVLVVPESADDDADAPMPIGPDAE